MTLHFAQLIELIKRPYASATEHAYPPLRNFILDVMAEGRRKNMVNLLMEVDVTSARRMLAEQRLHGAVAPSLTALIAWHFSATLDEDRRMQAYRRGASHLVVFDDVDLAVMIEREVDGEPLPVAHIVRGANRKSAVDLHEELRTAKTAPLGLHGPLTALEMRFFRLPAFLRRCVWFFIRRNPYWFKDLLGTAGLTSIGMFIEGPAVGFPISPMSITLSIGSITKKPLIKQGELIERDILQLNISADHDVIDGAPLTRFADRLRQRLEYSSSTDTGAPSHS